MQKDIDPKLLEEERRPTSPSTPLNIYGGTCTCDTTINFGELHKPVVSVEALTLTQLFIQLVKLILLFVRKEYLSHSTQIQSKSILNIGFRVFGHAMPLITYIITKTGPSIATVASMSTKPLCEQHGYVTGLVGEEQ